jgi:phospholipid/cholesterol/gamma-HCH transport system substrate-binding protein
MPRTRSLAWAELKIGVISILAVGIALLLIFLLSGEGGFSWEQYGLKTTFDNIAGLKPGAPVRVAGVEIGSVTDTNFSGDRVEVAMKVNKDYQHLITSDSLASLGSVSLLGEAAVDISAASRGTPIPEWGYIRSSRASGSLSDVASQATAGVTQLTAMLEDIREGKGTIGQFLTNDALYKDMEALLVSVNDVTRSINSGRGTVGRLLNDPAAAQSLERSLASLQAMTDRIQSGEGALGKFLTDDSFHRELVATTTNINALTGKINAGDGTMGQLMTNRELFDRFNSTADRIDKLVASLNAGEGTAGQLLHDKQLYENMNATMGEMRKLIASIAADPKKYLQVRVSIF